MKPGHLRISLNQVTPKQNKGTTLTFTSDELTELAHHLAAGDVLLQTKTRLLHRVMEAMARVDIKPSHDF